LPPKLDFDRIKTISEIVDVPLVLHGGSGLTDDDFKKAIGCGISKVNIFTDINIAAVKAEFSKFTDMNKGIIDLIPAAVEAVKQETISKMELFSSNGKASSVFIENENELIVKKVVAEVYKQLNNK